MFEDGGSKLTLSQDVVESYSLELDSHRERDWTVILDREVSAETLRESEDG